MSDLKREDVLKLAKLARLQLTEDELQHFTTELGAILEYVKQLDKVDVKDLEPTYQVTGLHNVTRKDEIKSYGPTPKELLKNAPATEADQFKVRRVL